MARKYVPKTKKFRARPRRNYRRRNTMSFYKAPMPNIFASKLRYVTNFSINPSLGSTGTHVICANGMYDPDITSIGHQPRGFDQLMTMYDHYTIIGSKITVQFCPNGNYNSHIFVALKDSSAVYTSVNEYLEGRNVVSSILQPAANGYVKTLVKTFSCKKFLGITKPLASDQARGSASANPLETAYFHIGLQPLRTVDEQDIQINVRIEYLAVFTEPKQPPQS